MSAVRVDREVVPGVTAADWRDALALVDAYRRGDAGRAGRVIGRADGTGLAHALLWLLAGAVDAPWLASQRKLLDDFMTGGEPWARSVKP